jgi:hypothetical protein
MTGREDCLKQYELECVIGIDKIPFNILEYEISSFIINNHHL